VLSGSTVIVADAGPQVAAFNAASGAAVWSVTPSDPSALLASPALSPDGNTVYAVNTGGELYAYNVTDGTPASGFHGGGAAVTSGSSDSPVVDAAGDVYLMGDDGTLYGFSAAGQQLWSIAGGTDAGQSGALSPGRGSPAIASDGTLYVGGNGGQVRGFRYVPPGSTATNTRTPSATATASATATITETPSPAGTTIPGDVPQLNEANAHYTRDASGLVHVKYYVGPVGIAQSNGWVPRDTTLSTTATSSISGTTTLGAAHALPFTAQLATSSGAPVQARLTSEDGVRLDLALASVNGATPTAVAGQVSGDEISFPAAVPASATAVGTPVATAATSTTSLPKQQVTRRPRSASTCTAGTGAGADFALRQTVGGLDARVTLHGAGQGGTVVFTLAPDAGASVVQDARGLAVQRPVQQCGDAGPGVFVTLLQTEYRLGPAVARDSAGDVGSLARTAPVSTTLTGAAAGPSQITVSIDSRWLSDPARVYPVTLDLPVVTAAADDETGVFGTVSSCAPDVQAVQAEVVVGVAGPCTYHGVAYFDVTRLFPQQAITSATLNLYTPDQTGDSGVQVYPNAPGPTYPPPPAPVTTAPPTASPSPVAVVTVIPLPAIQQGQLPTWNTAPSVGANGVGQRGSSGHWQTWDVTSAVQQWAANRLTNTGLMLVSGGVPVRFASPLMVGVDDASMTPYLDITFAAPTPAVASAQRVKASVAPLTNTVCTATPTNNPCNYSDGGSTIYGIGGRVYPDNYCATSGISTSLHACLEGIEEPYVRDVPGSSHFQLGAQYVRINVELPCSSHAISDPWWQQFWWYGAASRHAVVKPDMSPFGNRNRAYRYGLIPLLTLNPNDHCLPQDWPQWGSFAYWLSQYTFDNTNWPHPEWAANPPM
jgi:hypothetical protein